MKKLILLVTVVIVGFLLVTDRAAARLTVDPYGNLIFEGRVLGLDEGVGSEPVEEGENLRGILEKCGQFVFGSEEFYRCKKEHGLNGGVVKDDEEDRDENGDFEEEAWKKICKPLGFGTDEFYACKKEHTGIGREEGTRLHLQRDEEGLKVEVEEPVGGITDLGHEERIVVEETAEADRVEVSLREGRAVVNRNQTSAVTDLPLSVDLSTNELMVGTPVGERMVTVLPDEAVRRVLEEDAADRVESVPEAVILAERGGDPIYTIEGEKDHRLLGIFAIKTRVRVTISAQTGEITGRQQSFLDTLIDFFSI